MNLAYQELAEILCVTLGEFSQSECRLNWPYLFNFKKALNHILSRFV